MANLKFVSIDGGHNWYEWDRTSLAIREIQCKDGKLYEIELFNDDFKRIIYGNLGNTPEEAAQSIIIKEMGVQEKKS